MKTIEAAKELLHKQYCKEPWFRGVGISPGDPGLRLRLNVAKGHHLPVFPSRFSGFPLDVVEISEYRPRSGPP